jgi:thiol-disulfide isomerase/thioredoxin
MLDFWASWCGRFRRSLPATNRLSNRYSDAIFLGVNDENAAVIQRTRRDLGLTFPTALDVDDSISGLYGIRALPTTVTIDRDGRVVETIEGLPLDGAVVRAIAQAARG